MPIDTIRLSQTARDQLVQLKRHTGISNWNTLCRWGFCASLAEPSPARHQPIPSDSTVEMAWRTFSGNDDETFKALSLARHERDRIDTPTGDHFRLHLHRGIGYLAGDPRRKSIAGLLQIAVEHAEKNQS